MGTGLELIIERYRHIGYKPIRHPALPSDVRKVRDLPSGWFISWGDYAPFRAKHPATLEYVVAVYLSLQDREKIRNLTLSLSRQRFKLQRRQMQDVRCQISDVRL